MYSPHPTFTDLSAVPDVMEEGQVYDIEGIGRWLIYYVSDEDCHEVSANFVSPQEILFIADIYEQERFSVDGWKIQPAIGTPWPFTSIDVYDRAGLMNSWGPSIGPIDESPFFKGVSYSFDLPETDPVRGRLVEEIVSEAKSEILQDCQKRIDALMAEISELEQIKRQYARPS